MTEDYSPEPVTWFEDATGPYLSATQGQFTGAPSVAGFTGVPSASEAFTAPPIGSHFEDEGSNSIILTGVILATLLLFLCGALVFRYMLKHKGSYLTHEDKEGTWADSANAALKGGHSFEADLDEDV